MGPFKQSLGTYHLARGTLGFILLPSLFGRVCKTQSCDIRDTELSSAILGSKGPAVAEDN